MNQTYRQEEVEIDLIQFFKRICVQWRAVVAVGLVFGLLVMGGKYVKDTHDYNADLSAQNQPELSVEDLESSLTDAEKNAVYLAVNTQQQIESKEKYLRDSIYMNLDPDNYKVAYVYYMIKTDENTDACDVAWRYQVVLTSDESVSSLSNLLIPDKDVPYIGELFRVEQLHKDAEKRQTEVLKVSFILPKTVKEEDATSAMKSMVENCDKVRDDYVYTVSFVDSEVRSPSELEKMGVQDSQFSMRSALSSLTNTQNTSINSFSSEQKKLYELLTDSVLENEVETSSLVAPTISGKYFVVGVIIGVFLYCGLFFLYILFNPHAVEVSVCAISSLPSVGRINLSGDTNLENIIGQILVHSGNKENKTFQILMPGFDSSEDRKVLELITEAEKQGISLSAVPLDLSHIKESYAALNVDVPAIVAIYEKKTRKRDLRTLYDMLGFQNVRVLGELYIGE